MILELCGPSKELTRNATHNPAFPKARVPCTHMIRFLDFREAESIELKSCAQVSGQIIQNGFHTFMTISKG